MAIIYEKKGNIAFITINRPEVMNALDSVALEEIGKISIDIRDDDNVLVAIFTGAGDKAFCVGADLNKIPPASKDSNEKAAAQFWKKGSRAYQLMNFARGVEIWKPIIAAINGYCYAGGLEFALACDIRVASENATFALSEVQVGITVGLGTTQRLPRVVPLGVAMKMLLTGERIGAQQALQWGLITDVVPVPDLMPTAERIARRIADNAPLSLKAIKLASLKGLDLPIEYGIYLERLLFDMLRDTEDRIEGRRAFAEKRKPTFKGM